MGGHAAVLCTHRKDMIICFRRQIPILGSTRDAAGCALNCKRATGEGGRSHQKTGCSGRRHVSERLVNLVGATVVSHRNPNFCPTSSAPYLSTHAFAHARAWSPVSISSCFLKSDFVIWNLKGSSGRRAVQSQTTTSSYQDREEGRAQRYHKLMPNSDTVLFLGISKRCHSLSGP